MAINGPKIQLPSAYQTLVDEQGIVHPEWQTLLRAMQQTTYNITRSGPTVSRPTALIKGYYIGMQYYDTTLNKPIFLTSTNPFIWKDGTGTTV
jgi:hypothetical protein